MKKLFSIIVMLVWAAVAFAQQGVTLTQEQLNKLDPTVKSQIEALQTQDQVTNTLVTASKWAGLGKEIAVAFGETAKSLAMTAEQFAHTDLGKYTMVLIAYKVIGTDVLQLAFGLLWILIWLLVCIFWYRKHMPKRILISKSWNSEGKGWDRKYEFISGDSDARLTAIIVLCCTMVVSIPIIFA